PYLLFLGEVVAVTALILFFGEVMPKIYASQRAPGIARMMSLPLLLLQRAFGPLGSILIHSTDLVDERYARKGHNLSMSELSEAIDITSTDAGAEEDRRILKGIVKFSDMDVKEIMKSRVDVSAVDTSLNFRELLKFILDAGYSRIPAWEESFDRVVGILYIKDLLPHLGEDEHFAWQKLLRPAFFVPEGKPINELLTEFQERKIHMAIVVDEYGGTSGIVTLEDIIEEIVGEISDEFDLESEGLRYRQVSDNSWIFEGKASLNDFCKVAGIEDRIFERVKGESDTLAGLILELEGRIPPRNAVIRYEQFTFRIEEADPRRIHSIRVTIDPEED
ncbi:MAG TPA: gliding motility-associated protein GldE, partial [Bacteroidales bacterium]|nr:gliding motility-associated protein GldE [Bacteroidales bacterium]